MPYAAPRACACGYRIPNGEQCPCERKRNGERKARFDKTRPSSSARGYTGTWDKAKAEHLKSKPLCHFCGAQADTVDHITPHKGDDALFWDKTNWQSLCTTCHSRAKQRQERREHKGLTS